MLSIKNIYALLFMCVTHLGCLSNDRYRMESEDTSGPSSLRGGGYRLRSSESSGNVRLDVKVKKFLDEEYFEGGSSVAKMKFAQGSPVGNKEINHIIKELGKSLNISSIDKDYNDFLNKYGCVYGDGFEICGPTENISDNKVKIEYIVSIQRGFENRCRVNKITEQKVKLCWLIAEVDQGDQYYIKFEKNKEWLIYSMSLDGKSKPFARNFLEFLDKFFELYKIKNVEKESEEESD